MPAQTAAIDSLEFARAGQQLRGSLPLAGMSRLRDSLFDDRGEIQFEITGTRDARRRPALRVVVGGVLRLRCQRCLDLVDFPLRIGNTLLLAGSADEREDFDREDAEWVEASDKMDVAALIEDEIILSLPYSPRHAETQCRPAGEEKGRVAGSAFSGLAALKRSNH